MRKSRTTKREGVGHGKMHKGKMVETGGWLRVVVRVVSCSDGGGKNGITQQTRTSTAPWVFVNVFISVWEVPTNNNEVSNIREP